jgi:isocitrate dehydrogenase (NAD+)
MLTGSLGMLPSASLGAADQQGRRRALYEPVHGSAPDIAGQGKANPCALLLAAAQMLDHVGQPENAERLRKAIVATMEAKDSLTGDLGGTGTTMSFAKAIASRL